MSTMTQITSPDSRGIRRWIGQDGLAATRDEDHVLLARRTAARRTSRTPPRPRSRPRRAAAATRVRRASAARTSSPAVRRADGERQRARVLVPVGALEDSRLALEPAAVRLLDVLPARREDVEDEVPVRLEERVRRPEGAKLLLLRLHVQERAERADDERDALVHGRLAQVAEAEVERARRSRASSAASRATAQHRRGRVDADHAGRLPRATGSRSARCRRRARPRARPTRAPAPRRTRRPP